MTDFTDQVKLTCTAPSLTTEQIMNSLLVSAGGSGYTSAPSVTITGGGGSGATATASLTGYITGVPITNCGSGYTAALVSFDPEGAAAYPLMSGGQIIAIIITNGGNYASPPTVTITGNGSGATAQATMSVKEITVTNSGSGYTSDPTVTIAAPTGPAHACNTATAYAKAKPDETVDVVLGTFPKGDSYLTFDSSTDADALLITTSGGNPLVTINEGAIIEKDLMVGGFVSSGQGALFLNHGLVGKPKLSSPPCIEMMSSGEAYPSGTTLPSNPETGQLFTHNGTEKMWNGTTWVEGNFTGYYDTLFLFTDDGKTPAHMHLGELFATGGAKLNSVAIGVDEYGDIPYEYESIQLDTMHNLRFCFGTNERMKLTNSGRLELPVEGSTAGLRIGDVSLYRDSEYTLRLQNNLIVEGDAWCDNLAVDSGLGITSGSLTLGADVNLYRGGENVLKTDDSFYFGDSLSNGYLISQCSSALRFKHTSGQTMYIRPDENGSIIFFENPPGGPQNIYLKTLAATAGTTLQDSSSLTLVGKYWTGSASNDRYATIKHAMLSTAPTSELQITIGATQIGAWQSSGRLELPVNGASGGLRIGDVSLYRDSAYTLRLQNHLIVEQDLWCQDLAVDNNIGIGGNLTLADGGNSSVIAMYGDGIRISNGDCAYFYDNGQAYIGNSAQTSPVYLRGSIVRIDSAGGLLFGGDVTLYRQTSPSVCLELNDDMIIDGSLQVGSGLSVTGTIGATGNITADGYVHGGGSSGNAFKIGDDCYLVDINQANTIGVRGVQNSNIGGLRLGNSNWTQLKNDGAILYFQTYTSTGGILPSTGGYYTLGSSSKDWSYVYANYLRYDVNCVEYDALDDLALVKNHKSKKTIDEKSGEEITVIDMKESFPFLLADDNHIAHEKLQGYMLGCVKALAKKQDEHDALLLKLLNEVESLRATTSLKGGQ